MIDAVNPDAQGPLASALTTIIQTCARLPANPHHRQYVRLLLQGDRLSVTASHFKGIVSALAETNLQQPISHDPKMTLCPRVRWDNGVIMWIRSL